MKTKNYPLSKRKITDCIKVVEDIYENAKCAITFETDFRCSTQTIFTFLNNLDFSQQSLLFSLAQPPAAVQLVAPVQTSPAQAVANETALFRNKIEEKKSGASDEGIPLSSSENITTIKANMSNAKEDMKDLGEAIGSLFGGLFR